MPQYVTRAETNFYGEKQIVTRLEATTTELVIGFAAIGWATLSWLGAQEQQEKYKRIQAELKKINELYKDGDWDGVQAAADFVLADPSIARLYAAFVPCAFYKGRAARYSGDFDKAILYHEDCVKFAREAVSSDERWAYLRDVGLTAQFDRGCCYLALGKHTDAVRELTSLLHQEPTHSSALNARGVAFRQLGNYDASLNDLSAALHVYPDISDHYRERAKTYMVLGDPKKAMADYAQAIAFDPSNERPYLERGCALASIEEHGAAVDDFTQAIKWNPNSEQAYHCRAQSRHNLGQSIEAEQDERQAQEIGVRKETYARYLKKAQELYHQHGFTSLATEGDTKGPHRTLLSIGIVAALLVVFFLLNSWGELGFVAIPGAFVFGIIAFVTINQAIQHPRRASEFLTTIDNLKKTMPCFDEFFAMFISAKKSISLSRLEEKTRNLLGRVASTSAQRSRT